MRYIPVYLALLLIPAGLILALFHPVWGAVVAGIGLIGAAIGWSDYRQTSRSVLRNYPLSARLRYLLEEFRPEIRQYFVESDHDETPYSREQRALVYRRAKGIEGLRPFGTLRNVNEVGHEWINHSMAPSRLENADFRVTIGGTDCTQPYSASVLNISGMSYGALSPNAIEALNKGAKEGGFAHTTGEGSISRFHRLHGGDLIWQIGSGYFGCRTPEGRFDPETFAQKAQDDQVKMIEIKLSQGAKPGHGGILPGAKVTEAIAEARGVPVGEACNSPAAHGEFTTPVELCNFIQRLRDASGGKPVGIKLCVGHPWEWFAAAKAMRETGIVPDFITIDGSEGGTGAAPAEFADHRGAPLHEGLMLVHNTLVGLNLRDKTRLIVAGKLVSAFDICRMFALGADGCNMARGFMFALGCIQAQACHTDKCPTGVTTQDPGRYRALVIDQKYRRVANFHGNTMHALKEAVESSGLRHPSDLTPHHLMIRVNSREVRSAASQYDWVTPGDLSGATVTHPAFAKYWDGARTDTFAFAA
ncbi:MULTISPECIES: FMN-binding glutamate synthase family protein [Sediminimonas]|uniref:FMN-binding glutamate synthase family protein n=1 Tax=Sediminimonas TaxID=659427 RepID=UPI00041ADCDB|nr:MULTISPECIES: FMN-binding glutamate synthase family protein [Sediminimonas]MDR9484888.1 FMN-binding glutamate synthase family protein [Sediminimonas sp.]